MACIPPLDRSMACIPPLYDEFGNWTRNIFNAAKSSRSVFLFDKQKFDSCWWPELPPRRLLGTEIIFSTCAILVMCRRHSRYPMWQSYSARQVVGLVTSTCGEHLNFKRSIRWIGWLLEFGQRIRAVNQFNDVSNQFNSARDRVKLLFHQTRQRITKIRAGFRNGILF